jgi:phosphoribosyl 1,2-cyclic phosphodiesterase
VYDIYVLGSSSKGNCIYVSDGEFKILLDCGLSLKNIKQQLHSQNITLSDIDYILITHEHSDHIRGLKHLIDSYNTKVIASRGTLQDIDISKNNIIYIKDNQELILPNIIINAKRVNHDANEPLCFSIKNSLGEKLLYLTDCGMVKYMKFKDFDVYIIEANYSEEQLELNYKQGLIHEVQYSRAFSGMGHLDINSTIDFLKNNIGENTKKIIFSHLSTANSNKEEFKKLGQNKLSFKEVYIAEEGLHLNCGINPQPF